MHTHTGLFAAKSSDFSAQKQQKEKSFMENTSPAGKQSPGVPLPPGPEEEFGDWDVWPFACLGIPCISHSLHHHPPGTC